MIFGELEIVGELGIVGSEERLTYKKRKKKAIIRTQRYQILESKIALVVISTCIGMKDQPK